MGRFAIVLSFLLAAFAARAEQVFTCEKPDLEDLDLSSERLQAIAETCRQPAIAGLFYKRAYMRELMEEYEYFNSILSSDHDSQARFESYRILLGLAEAFAAKALLNGDTDIVSRLSKTYEEYIEIAELRLKGYDLIANHMERKLHL